MTAPLDFGLLDQPTGCAVALAPSNPLNLDHVSLTTLRTVCGLGRYSCSGRVWIRFSSLLASLGCSRKLIFRSDASLLVWLSQTWLRSMVPLVFIALSAICVTEVIDQSAAR